MMTEAGTTSSERRLHAEVALEEVVELRRQVTHGSWI